MNECSQSTLPLNTTGPFAGLKLIKESIKKDTNFENGITICLRFNFMTLIGSIVFKHDRPGSPSMFEGQANYRQTFFFFGTMNWIIKDVKLDTFLVWSTNRWHSICVAFDRTTSHITFVKVFKSLQHICVYL